MWSLKKSYYIFKVNIRESSITFHKLPILSCLLLSVKLFMLANVLREDAN